MTRFEDLPAREKTARRRAERADCSVEVPINKESEVECPGCETSFNFTIVTGISQSPMPSYDTCPNHECDCFIQFRWNGVDGSSSDTEEPEIDPDQAGLDQFEGGESA